MEATGKPIRKTVYINRNYYDVIPFFEQEGSSKLICELVRREMGFPSMDISNVSLREEFAEQFEILKTMLATQAVYVPTEGGVHPPELRVDLRQVNGSNSNAPALVEATAVSDDELDDIMSVF